MPSPQGMLRASDGPRHLDDVTVLHWPLDAPLQLLCYLPAAPVLILHPWDEHRFLSTSQPHGSNSWSLGAQQRANRTALMSQGGSCSHWAFTAQSPLQEQHMHSLCSFLRQQSSMPEPPISWPEFAPSLHSIPAASPGLGFQPQINCSPSGVRLRAALGQGMPWRWARLCKSLLGKGSAKIPNPRSQSIIPKPCYAPVRGEPPHKRLGCPLHPSCQNG